MASYPLLNTQTGIKWDISANNVNLVSLNGNGTTGQVLQSNGAGAPSWATITTGTPTLASVMSIGNKASTFLDMSVNAITNITTATANNVNITTGLILPSINSGTAVISSGKLICNLSSFSQGGFFVDMSDNNITDISFNNPKSGGVYYFYLQGASSARRFVGIIPSTKILSNFSNVAISAGLGTKGVLTAAYDGTRFIINCTSYEPSVSTKRIIAQTTTVCLYSSDGITWNKVTNAYPNAPGPLTYSAGVPSRGYYDASFGYLGACRTNASFGTAGSCYIIYSPDGLNWSGNGINQVFSTTAYCIVNPTKSLFLAGGFGNNSLAYSSDGFNWTGLGNVGTNNYVKDIAWSPTANSGLPRYVAVGGSSGTNTIVYSSDGINWTGAGNTIVTDCVSVVWAPAFAAIPGRFVAVGAGTNYVAYSSDGINWTGLGSTLPFSISASYIAFSPTLNRLVAAGAGTNAIAYSDDNGATWTGLGLTSPASPFTSTASYVAWVGDKFIAAGAGTNINAYSSTGLSSSWTALPTTNSNTAPNANLINILWNGI